jgi:hypothetical protein
MALTLGIASQPAAAEAYLLGDVLSRGNVTTSGEIGNRYALLALGHMAGGVGVDAVWSSLLRQTSPGYGWMLVMGETALAESWTDAPGDSHIHAMYGHVDEFLYSFVSGIQQQGVGSVGWRQVRIAPHLPPGLQWVNASFDSPRGLIAVAVERLAGDAGVVLQVTRVTITLPPGVEGVLALDGLRPRPATSGAGEEDVVLTPEGPGGQGGTWVVHI